MADFDIFAATNRPDPALFYRRNDPNDPRLGEIVTSDPQYYAEADFVILGCPQDEGVRRNQGRVGAVQGPAEIRRYLYRLAASLYPQPAIFDLGDTLIQPELEGTHDLHRQIVEQVLWDGKRLIVLGGGNDISYPDGAAFGNLYPPDVSFDGRRTAFQPTWLAFNVDAHFDVRADSFANSGTPYRQLIEEGWLLPANFYEMGNLEFSNSLGYRRYLEEKGAHIYDLAALQDRPTAIEEIFGTILRREAAALFWGFDLDVVNVSAAPGVSAPNPLGLSGAEFCRIARIAGLDERTRLVEFSELNPLYDIDGRSARLVAAAIFNFLAGFQASQCGERKN